MPSTLNLFLNSQDTYICCAYNPRCFIIQKVKLKFDFDWINVIESIYSWFIDWFKFGLKIVYFLFLSE